MPEPIAAIVGSSVLGAGASIVAGGKQADAAQAGADAQVQAARESNELQKWIYEDTKAMNQPWVDAGMKALGKLQGMAGIKGVPDAPKLQKKTSSLTDEERFSDKQFIEEIYKQGLMAQPDEQGANYWTNNLAQSGDRVGIANQMASAHQTQSGGSNRLASLGLKTKEEQQQSDLINRQNALVYGGRR